MYGKLIDKLLGRYESELYTKKSTYSNMGQIEMTCGSGVDLWHEIERIKGKIEVLKEIINVIELTK